MAINQTKGNMYKFITHTWNPIKGKCSHNCSYCYMKKFGRELSSLKIVDSELRSKLGNGNFIFVGSGTDMFAKDVPKEWIDRVLDYCAKFNNKYLFQSKNPQRILEFIDHPVFKQSVVCTTIETNRFYNEVMNNAPKPEDRASAMEKIAALGVETYVTIEPIIDFDLKELVDLIKKCKPSQIALGQNSWRQVRLEEPNVEKICHLIDELLKLTKVVIKDNIKKSIPESYIRKCELQFKSYESR